MYIRIRERFEGAIDASKDVCMPFATTKLREKPWDTKIGDSFSLFLVLVAGFVLANGTARAAPTTWADDQLSIQLLSPNSQTVAFNGLYNFNGRTGFSIQPFQDNPFLVLFVYANGEVSLHNLAGGSDGSAVFANSNVIKISDLTSGPIQSVRVDPTSSTGLNSGPLFGSNFLQFDAYDFINHRLNPYSNFVLDTTFASSLGSGSPVPEPASLALFGTALLGLGGLTVRQLRRTV